MLAYIRVEFMYCPVLEVVPKRRRWSAQESLRNSLATTKWTRLTQPNCEMYSNDILLSTLLRHHSIHQRARLHIGVRRSHSRVGALNLKHKWIINTQTQTLYAILKKVCMRMSARVLYGHVSLYK